MKKIGVILILLIFLIVGLSIAKDVIIKTSIEGIISITTGLKMDIGELRVNIAKTFINIKDIIILNPPHFNDRIMLFIPEIFIDYDTSTIFKKQIHLNDVYINLKEFTIVKNKEGKTNIGYIKSLKQKESKKERKASKAYDLQIDRLSLKIGRVLYKDYSRGKEPLISEYNINLDSRYKNVKNADQIMRIIISKAIMETAIGALSDFSKFKDIASDTLESSKNIFKETVDELKGILKRPFKTEEQNDQ